MHNATLSILSFRERLFLAAPMNVPAGFPFDDKGLPKPPKMPPDVLKCAKVRFADRENVRNWHRLCGDEIEDNDYAEIVKSRYPKLHATWTAYWRALRAYKVAKRVAETAQWRWYWADAMLAHHPSLTSTVPACSSTTPPVWCTDVNSAELKALLRSVSERVGPAKPKGSAGGRIMRRADGSTVSLFGGKAVYEPSSKVKDKPAEVAAHTIRYRKTRPDKRTPLSVRFAGMLFAVGNRESVKKLAERLNRVDILLRSAGSGDVTLFTDSVYKDAP